MMRIQLLAGTCIALAATSVTQAAISYSYAAEQHSYEVEPGEAFTVNLLLRETLTGGSDSLLATYHLYSAGISVARQSGTATNPAEITGASMSPAFEGYTDSSFTADTAAITENFGTNFDSGVAPINRGGGIFDVPLGSISLMAGEVVGETTVFSLNPYSSLGGYTILAEVGYDLDFDSTDPAYSGAVPTEFTVTVVPEPATLVLVGGVAAFATLRRRAYR